MREILKVENLKKSYQGKAVLKGLNFHLRTHEIVAFLGPNGAGKSTTMKMIMGLRHPDHGEIKVFNESPKHLHVKDRIGYTSQELSFPPHLLVHEVLNFVGAHYKNSISLAEIFERFQLEKIKKSTVSDLSGGEKRRLGLACALIGKPQLLILDEPTTGLDVESRHNLWKEILNFREAGGAVLLSTHDLNEVGAIADRVILMDEGQILITGTVKEIKSRIEFQKISYRWKNQEYQELVQNSDQFVKNLVREKPEFQDLLIHPVTLEEAFLKIRSQS